MVKPEIKIRVKDWRVAMMFGFMAGIIVAIAPSLLTLGFILGSILILLKLIEAGRI